MNEQEQFEKNLSPETVSTPEIPDTQENLQINTPEQQPLTPEAVIADAESKLSGINSTVEKFETLPTYQEKAISEAGGSIEEIENRTKEIDSRMDKIKEEADKAITEWVKVDQPDFDKDSFYRIINEAGYQDMQKNNIIRSSPEGAEPQLDGRFGLISGRPTPFPSFSQGSPNYLYLKKGEDNYILESGVPMYRRGDTNPMTGNKIRGGHWAYRPFDESGNVIKEMKPEMLKNIYKVDAEGNTYVRKKGTAEAEE